MVDFDFTEEQEIYRRTLREFLEKRLMPESKKIFEKKDISENVWRAVADFGLTGLLLPEEYGGSNSDFVSFVVAIEELSRADYSGLVSTAVLLSNTEGAIVARHGNELLKEELLPKITKGEAILGLGSTEPGCGTDFTAVQTRVERRGEEYVVNGEKQCISLTRETRKFGGGHLVTGKTTPELGHRGMSLVYVPIDSKGVESSEFDTLGPLIGRIRYEDVRVPVHYLVGEENGGVYLVQESFVITRIPVAASLLGPLGRILRDGIEYVKQRKAFGYPIGKFQGIQFQLAEHYSRWEANRWLVYRAAWMVDEAMKKGRFDPFQLALAASEAKLLSSMDSLRAVNDIAMWYGAMGITTEVDVHFALRGLIGAAIAEGTVEAQKIVIGNVLLGKECSSTRFGD